ncbi:MAG: sugar phosphate isomerase/epimerase [Phycisphaeraceae bacterium]|nr:sugar phosphate isomerase/epimerase [Phycisphaeraceae bacterium]
MAALKVEQLGVCSWSMHPKSAADLAEQVRAVGLQKVQLALNPVADDVKNWGQVQQELSKAGIAIGSGMFGCAQEDYSTLESIRRTGGFMPDDTWEKNQAIAKQAAATAAGLGLTLVSTHAGFLPEDVAGAEHEKALQRVIAVAKIFADKKLTLLFETGQEDARTLVDFMQTLRKRGVSNVGVNFDPANMILYDKGDPIRSLGQLLAYVRQVHIKDAVKTTQPGTWGNEVSVGQGQVDWPAFVETLAQGNFAGGMMIEREAGAQRGADIRQAVNHLGKLLGKSAE